MKKIELNTPLKFVLIILTWLLTFTVVNLTATLNNGGVGLIGTLVLYVGLLYLAFGYFNDCDLKKACKTSLIVMVVLICVNLFIQCYGYFLSLCEINSSTAFKIQAKLSDLFLIGKNVVIIVFLLISMITSLKTCDGNCCCKKEAPKAEAKEEAKEVEAPKEETKEETKDEE